MSSCGAGIRLCAAAALTVTMEADSSPPFSDVTTAEELT
ncbi:hypothetical protein RAS1_10960 [Phycisphaerae bacterium RAS1]|nr:hypothetical protein RAS1_10960 [Phycisphaerae bacterium RAS1]